MLTASLTMPGFSPDSSLLFRYWDMMYINRTVAAWLVVIRRMGVKVLIYLKLRNSGDLRIFSYSFENKTARPDSSSHLS